MYTIKVLIFIIFKINECFFKQVVAPYNYPLQNLSNVLRYYAFQRKSRKNEKKSNNLDFLRTIANRTAFYSDHFLWSSVEYAGLLRLFLSHPRAGRIPSVNRIMKKRRIMPYRSR